MNEREEYQRRVRELAAQRAEVKPKRSLGQRIRDFGAELARRAADRPTLKVVPKHRFSGPRLVTDWHEEAVNKTLPLSGQRCLNRDCRASMLPGSDPLHTLAGLCGKCFLHAQGTPAAPLKTGTDDGPRAA